MIAPNESHNAPSPEMVNVAGRTIYGDVWPTVNQDLMKRALTAALALPRKDGAVCAGCREACAKVADKWVRNNSLPDTIARAESDSARHIAAAIRSLAGETPGPATNPELDRALDTIMRPGFGEPAPALPTVRCDNCDNGVELEWEYCAWCGATKDWVHETGDV